MTTVEKQVGFSSVTPSGLEVYYQEKPKRLYRVRRQIELRAMIDEGWTEVPSVTTVLNVLDKPALPFWGMRVGIEAVIELAKQQKFCAQLYTIPLAVEDETWQPATLQNVERLVVANKLSTNHQRDKAGDRGVSVHKALEKWIENGTLPVVDYYPESEQGYIAGLLAFLTDLGTVTSAKTEVMVGSLEHEYAGRYDLECRIRKCSLVTNAKKDIREDFPAGLYLLDAKTSAGIYESHFIQLEAYEGARLECGYKPTKGRMVVRLDKSGTYEVGLSKLSLDHFLAILGAYYALADVKALQK